MITKYKVKRGTELTAEWRGECLNSKWWRWQSNNNSPSAKHMRVPGNGEKIGRGPGDGTHKTSLPLARGQSFSRAVVSGLRVFSRALHTMHTGNGVEGRCMHAGLSFSFWTLSSLAPSRLLLVCLNFGDNHFRTHCSERKAVRKGGRGWMQWLRERNGMKRNETQIKRRNGLSRI